MLAGIANALLFGAGLFYGASMDSTVLTHGLAELVTTLILGAGFMLHVAALPIAHPADVSNAIIAKQDATIRKQSTVLKEYDVSLLDSSETISSLMAEVDRLKRKLVIEDDNLSHIIAKKDHDIKLLEKELSLYRAVSDAANDTLKDIVIPEQGELTFLQSNAKRLSEALSDVAEYGNTVRHAKAENEAQALEATAEEVMTHSA